MTDAKSEGETAVVRYVRDGPEAVPQPGALRLVAFLMWWRAWASAIVIGAPLLLAAVLVGPSDHLTVGFVAGFVAYMLSNWVWADA